MSRLRFEDVERFVREYNLDEDNPSDYDFNGVVYLLSAAIDNLRDRALPADLAVMHRLVSEDQRRFIVKLARLLDKDSSAL